MVYSSSSTRVMPVNIRQSIENPLNLSTYSKNEYALRYSVVTAVNHRSFKNEDQVSNADSDGSIQSDGDPSREKLSCLRSVKIFIISIVTTLVVISALVVSATWLSSFGPAITSLSSTIRKNEFAHLQSYIERTLKEIVLVVNTAQSQFPDHDLEDPSSIEHSLFKFFKSESLTHDALPAAILIGNQTDSLSIIQWGPIPAFVDIGVSFQKVYYCTSGLTLDHCERSESPNMVMPSFDLKGLHATALSSPGKSLFTPSYNVGADLTFVTMITSWLSPNSTEITKYLALSMELKRISRYLEDLVSKITSSTAFIIETQTDFLIAVNNRTIPLAYLADNQIDIVRRTGLTVQSAEHVELAKDIYKQFPNLKSLTCNKMFEITTSNHYVTLYRFCSEYNIDWVIAMSTPQWNYISPIIIALLAAIGGSLVIIGISVLVGIAFSFSIVKPFKTLKTMFESVSTMNIDDALLMQQEKSYFSEMNYVQTHFEEMLKKLKLYRAFIPGYLLAELDGNKQEESNTNNDNNKQRQSVNQSTAKSKILASSNFNKSGILDSIDMIKSEKSTTSKKGHNMFSLYLETKEVSFVGVFLDGLDVWYKSEDCKSVVNLLSLVYEQIGATSRTHGFNVGSFENDMIILSFNSTRDCSNHVEKALSTIQILKDKLEGVRNKLVSTSCSSSLASKKSEKVSQQLADHLKFRFAVTTQRVFCGNVGTSDCKNFSIVSSAKTNLEKLLESGKRLDLKVVIPERIVEIANTMFQTRFVDSKMLNDDRFYQNSIFARTDSLIDIVHEDDGGSRVMSNFSSQENIYELGASNKVSDEEWMYELHKKNQLLKWKKYQEACVEYFSERFENALKLFEEFMAESSNKETAESLSDSGNPPQLEPPLDKPSLVLSRICKMKLGIL